MMSLTPWVRRLLIANVVVFLIAGSSPALYRLLLLYPPLAVVRPWTLVTYMFLHAGLSHLVFNMLGLFIFGPRLEDRLGGKAFLWLYFLSGLGGAVFSFFFAREAAVVGASGAVYGVLLGFAMYWPRERIYIWMILPVEAWLLATLIVFGSLYAGLNPGADSRTAHFAHLGGLLFAFVFLRWRDWRTGSGRREFQRKMNVQVTSSGIGGDRATLARWKGIQIGGLHELNREEVQRLIAKAEASGAAELTPAERSFLDRMAKG